MLGVHVLEERVQEFVGKDSLVETVEHRLQCFAATCPFVQRRRSRRASAGTGHCRRLVVLHLFDVIDVGTDVSEELRNSEL